MVFLLIASVLGLLAPPAMADGGDYHLDFTAAAPQTYDHTIGGGAFNDRTVGVAHDIVESLEGGDFECLETVTYLTQIRREDGPGTAETLELRYSFLADTTGQSGVAMTEVLDAKINYGLVVNGDGPGGTDLGIEDDGGSVASFVQTDNGIDFFTKGSEIYATVTVTDVEPGENIVLRVDVLLDCEIPKPTGNLQAQLNYTNVVESDTAQTPDVVPGGEQTIPFKQVSKIYPVACPEQDYIYDGQDPSCNEGLEPAPNASLAGASSDQQAAIPVVGTVLDQASDNPEISIMSITGGLLAFAARRRRSGS